MSRIIEQCACGARIEFDKRPRQTYADQDAADNEFLSKFRAEHSCPFRVENVEAL